MSSLTARQRLQRRHVRLRKKVTGTATRPRLCFQRTLNHTHAQIVDDVAGVTLVSASTVERALRGEFAESGTGNTRAAAKLGVILAERAQAKNVCKVVFDRGGNQYHGRVQALAESARKAGLEF